MRATLPFAPSVLLLARAALRPFTVPVVALLLAACGGGGGGGGGLPAGVAPTVTLQPANASVMPDSPPALSLPPPVTRR